MRKHVTALILTILLILTLVPVTAGAASEGTKVSTAAEFEAMVSGGTYYLANDIDLGGKEYNCYIFAEFSGTIDGNGYSVFNYKLTNGDTESDVGTIQRSNKTGDLIIKDLSFGKENSPVKMYVTSSGKSHGIICGAQENANKMVLDNVSVYADIDVPTVGKCNVGGYIGYSRAFTMTNCRMYGKVSVGSGPEIVDTVYHNAGGFVGSANNDAAVLDNCENYAEISAYCSLVEARAAGFIAYSGNIITLENCTNYGKIICYDTKDQISASQAGGIMGHINKSPAILINCTNNGEVTASQWAAGFIANVTGGASLEGCVNNGIYSKDAALYGPFFAFVSETTFADTDAACRDNTDPNAPPIAEVTTAPAEVTTPPAVTTAPPVTDEPGTTTPPATEAPNTDAPASTTAAPATDKPADKPSGSCKNTLIVAPVFLIAAGTALIFRKKKQS